MVWIHPESVVHEQGFAESCKAKSSFTNCHLFYSNFHTFDGCSGLIFNAVLQKNIGGVFAEREAIRLITMESDNSHAYQFKDSPL